MRKTTLTVVQKVCFKSYNIYYLLSKKFLISWLLHESRFIEDVRGQTTYKNIHARNLEEREEVTFDKGQAIGPTSKIVFLLTNFI